MGPMLSKYDLEQPVANVYYWNHAYPALQAQSMYWYCIVPKHLIHVGTQIMYIYIYIQINHISIYIIYHVLALELVAGSPYEHGISEL